MEFYLCVADVAFEALSVVVVGLAFRDALVLDGLVLGLGRLRLEERVLLDLSPAGDQAFQAVVLRDLEELSEEGVIIKGYK